MGRTQFARIIRWSTALISCMALTSCNRPMEGFTKDELVLIHGADSIMRVLTTEDAADRQILRNQSSDLPASTLESEDFKRLAQLLVATVTHPSQDGVGIAGPQVGLNRRVIAVQRFDKGTTTPDGTIEYPFEVYPNIRIVWASEALASGPEGCLSVPNRRGEVMRSQEIVIEYADITRLNEDNYMVRDTVKGFTAVIFQHESDHLEGILFTDKINQ